MTTISVRDFHAVGDGKADDTKALQGAIDAASAAGGGVVAVPAGTYRVGTIHLRSRITLDLLPGAMIQGSADLADYHTGTWGHHNDLTPWHLILAEDCDDICIRGMGAIDGGGHPFWNPDRQDPWDFWKERRNRPSPMVELVRCRNAVIEHCTFQRSAGWTLHLHDCDMVRISHIRIRNSIFGPNCDGIDMTGCQDVTITGCDIETGDDAIAMKTNEYSRPMERIAVSNCVLRTNCVGVRIGYESRKDFRDIAISNLSVPHCSRVFDLRSVEGCTIERVSISNIQASTNCGWPVNRPIELVLAHCPSSFKDALTPDHHDHGKDRPLTTTGAIRDISIRGCDIRTDGRVSIIAQDGLQIERVVLDGIRLHYAMLDDPAAFVNARSTGYMPNIPQPRGVRAAFLLQNVRKLRMTSTVIDWPEYPVAADWHLLHTKHRHINKAFITGNEDRIRSGEHRVRFAAVWTRNVRDSRIDLDGLTDSEGNQPAMVSG